MTADEVRAQLEEELGGTFTETTWKRLYRDEVKAYLISQTREAWQSLEHLAEDLFAYEKELKRELASGDSTESDIRKRRLGQRRFRQDQTVAEEHWFPELDHEELLRAEVYGESLAKVAAADYYVARYRKRVLGERTVTVAPDQAHSLIHSAAAQTLKLSFFHRMRIPVCDHNAELIHREADTNEAESVEDYATIRVKWPENSEGNEWSVRSAVTEGKDLAWLEFRNEVGKDDRMAVRRDSVLGELQRLAKSLTEQFPWREAQATWFILTGEPPAVTPIKARYTSRPAKVRIQPSGDTRRFAFGELTISAAPWVSEKLVAEAYYNLQRQIIRGQQNRPAERRRLEVLRFVLQKENPIGLTRARRRQIGKELVEAWDRKYPKWAYGGYSQPTSAFWAAYNAAERSVLHPSWTHPRRLNETGDQGAS